MDKKFRCHPSIILEKIGGMVGFFIIILFSSIDDIVELIETGEAEGNKTILLIVVAVLFISVVYNIFVWRKTYISVNEGTIVIEKNTINKKVNTFGIKNISNINIEQNLFERLISTCKVKIDTDSLSTSDETDIEIVLKKDTAYEFKNKIMEIINENNEALDKPQCENISDENNIEYDIAYSSEELLKHCLYNISISGLIISIAIFVGAIGIGIEQDNKTLGNILVIAIIVIGNFMSVLKNLIGDYIKYYDFKISRKNNKIYLNYGLIKKVEYSIPVERINAVTIKQNFLSRLLKKYKVEINTIGLNDDEDESSQIILYEGRERVVEKLDLLLSEFNLDVEENFEKQPKNVFVIRFVKSLVILGVFNLVLAIIYELNLFRNVKILLIANLILVLLLSIYYLMKYVTSRICVDDDFVLISSGQFSRKIDIIRYDKIQYVEINQGPVSKRFGLRHGAIYILAGATDRDKVIDYCRSEIFEELSQRI